MSLSFRPVKEIWGDPSSCFVDADVMLQVLQTIADEVGSHNEAHAYGDNNSIWIEDGGRFLDFISNERLFTAGRIARTLALNAAHQLNDLKFLVSNMRILADKWRESIDVHGALTFYVDAC